MHTQLQNRQHTGVRRMHQTCRSHCTRPICIYHDALSLPDQLKLCRVFRLVPLAVISYAGLKSLPMPTPPILMGHGEGGIPAAEQCLVRLTQPDGGRRPCTSPSSDPHLLVPCCLPADCHVGESDGLVSYEWGLSTARRLATELPTSSSLSFLAYPHVDHELADNMVGGHPLSSSCIHATTLIYATTTTLPPPPSPTLTSTTISVTPW